MLEVRSSAIVATDLRLVISTCQQRFSAPLAMVGGTSVLRRLLSQWVRAGVQRMIIMALEWMGDIASDLGGELHGMDLCLRALPTPNGGRLIDAVTATEIAEVDRDVLAFTEDIVEDTVVDFSLIERLLRSSNRNTAVTANSRGRASLRIAAYKALRLSEILPEDSVRLKEASADLVLVGVNKFEPALLRVIVRNRPRRAHNDLELFEVASGIQAHQIMRAEPQCVLAVTNAANLKAADSGFISKT